MRRRKEGTVAGVMGSMATLDGRQRLCVAAVGTPNAK